MALLVLGAGDSVGVSVGTFSVIGTRSGSETVVLSNPVSGQLNVILDPSFNQGGDRIVLAGSASDYTIVRSGSSVVLTNGAITVTIPVGFAGAEIVFANGAGTADDDVRVLRFDSALGGVVLAGATADETQIVGLSVAPVAGNDAPVLANAIADQSVAEDTALNFTVPANAFSDVDNAVLTYSATLGDGSALPAWLSFDAATRIFSGTPPQDFNGNIDLRVTASDGSLSASDTFTLTVTPVNDAPVLANAIADQSVAEDTAVNFIVPANAFNDVDGGTLTYSAALAGGSALPAWLSFNPATRTFAGTPPLNFNGIIDLRVTASDGSLSVSDTFRLTVNPVNDAPLVTSGATATVDENQTAAYTATATDVDAGTTLAYSLLGTDAGLFNIDSSTGVVTFKVAPDFEAPADDNDDNAYQITVRATDEGGLFDDQAVTITVADVQEQLIIDLTTLSAAQGFIIQGDAADDFAGRSVSSAGDVNGDGFDDLIIGASFGDDGGNFAGEAYVVFGSATGFGSTIGGRQVIDLTSLTAAQGFIIQGDTNFDQAGYSVSAAGDVNGDGFDDLIVGAISGDDGGTDAGEAYVVLGSASGFGTAVGGRQVIDLTSLTAAQGFIVQGDTAEDASGWSVSSAGDVNGDGFDDLIVGAQVGDDGGPGAGEAYVVFGSGSGFGSTVTTAGTARQVIDLTSLSAAQGFIIQGDTANDRAGWSVSRAGDVNGDGFDDLIVGAPFGDDGGNYAGEAYVVFGSASGFGVADVSGRQVIDLTSLTAAQGFIIQGDAVGDQAGYSVSSAGDINGDGFDDLIVGANRGDDGGTDAGEAYVIFGGATGTEDTAPVTLAGTAAVDNFTGNAGDDTFTGIAAGDVVRGGAGDDSIAITATSFADIRGGRGTDTLALAGTGLSLDLTSSISRRLDSIEVIDLTGTGNNSLIVSELAIYRITEERSGGEATLIVEGNAGDSVDAQDFIVSGTQVVGGVTYNLFEKGDANLLVALGVTVTGANNRPVATDDSGTANEDAPLVVTAASTTLGASGLLTNDTDLDSDPLSITAVNGVAANVGTQITLASGALLTVNANGSYTYNPNGQFETLRPGDFDTDSFTYTLSDGQLTDTATVTITIEGRNEAPVVAAPIADEAFNEDTAVNFTVPAGAFTDADNATLTYSAALESGAALPTWLDFNATTRTFTGTPPLNFNGVFDIRVTASDGDLSANDVFRLTITPVNDAPVGVNDAFSTNEDQALTISLSSLVANDTDVENQAIGVGIINNPVNGTFALIGTDLIFTPASNFFGTASFAYRPRDASSLVGSEATVTITVNSVNDAPVVAAPLADRAFNEDTAVNFTVPAGAFADVDNATLTYSAALESGAELPTWLDFNATTRTFTGTPPTDFNGVFDIRVTASDGTLSANDVFRLTITPVNDAPEAPNGTAATDEDTAVTVVEGSGLLAGVTDVDGPSLAVTQIDGQAFTFGTPITLASGALLTVQSNGSYVYNPNGQFEALRPNDSDTDSFEFTVSDGSLTDTATITVTIDGRNEVPIAGNDTLSMTGNTPITITAASLLLNDTDPDGDPTSNITLTAVGGAMNGTVSLDAGSITFTPNTGYTGAASFTYTIQDADGATAIGTVNITVSGLVWYVDNSFAGVSDGSFLNPYTSLAPLNGTANDGTTAGDRDGAGDTIFVARTGINYVGGITLEAGQKLFGDGYEFEINGIDIGGGVTTNSTINQNTTGIILSTDNEVRGLTINGFATSAVGIQDGNGTVGNLTIAGVSVVGDGKAIDIDQGGNLAVTIDTLNSDSSTSEGVHLQGVTGSFEAISGVIRFAADQGFLIGAEGGGTANSGGNATITYGGNLSNNGAGTTAGIEIQDRSGGVVTFTGNISDFNGPGIVADGNSGTINFGGQVAIDSGASTAISLTNNSAAINFTPTGFGLDIITSTGNGFIVDGGGGTVTLSGTGNTVTTTSGRAVEIDGVTIGTGGVNFQSVTVTNGTSTTGIFLRNAGSGGFNITGTASTAGSGGNINSIDGGTDGSIEQGIGIYIQNTNNISLSNIAFTGNFANFGIRGSVVQNFTLRDSTFNAADTDDGGFGDNSGQDEGVIRFTGLTSTENGLTGTALFEGNTISDGEEDVLRIDNVSGTLNLTVRDSADDAAIIGRNGTLSGNDGIIVNGSGTSNITVLIEGVQFTGNRGEMIQTVASGTATQNVTIRNNTFANLHPDLTSGGGGISVSLSGGTGSGPGVTYNIEGNTFTGAEGTVILTQALGPVGRLSGTILNNAIGTAGGGYNSAQATTGSNGGGNGIEVRVEKESFPSDLTHAVRIEGNTIRDVDGFGGIFLRSNGASDGSGTARLEATIRNNTIAELGPNALSGIYAQIGGGGGSDDGLLGLDISNNTINTNGASNALGAIVFDDIANDSQFYLPGFVGTPTDGNVQNFLTVTRGNTLTVTSPVEQFITLAATGTYLTGASLALPVPLMVEPGTTGTGSGVQATESALEALREAAVQLWIDAGASDAQIAAMRAVELGVADLFGGFLGQTNAGVITIDIDAAGIGWFIDATPYANEEFAAGPDGLTALSGSEAAGGIDLLTAIAHELGHVVGLDDLYGSDAEGVMDGFLAAGERNLPEAITAPAVGGGGGAIIGIGDFDIDTMLHGIETAGQTATSLTEMVSGSDWYGLEMLQPLNQMQVMLVVDVAVL